MRVRVPPSAPNFLGPFLQLEWGKGFFIFTVTLRGCLLESLNRWWESGIFTIRVSPISGGISVNDGLLKIRGLKTYFFTRWGIIKAVDDVDLEVGRGETLGLVGESGCGKSVTALSVLRLVPKPKGRIVGGEIIFMGKNLLELDEGQMRMIRGGEIGMIFQEPMTSLNPVFTIGAQVTEALCVHKRLKKKEARQRAIELLRLVGMPDASLRMKDYPHQLSGGMRQRVMIAMALAGDPILLIADEPTTALDVTIQAQILELIQGLREKRGLAMVLITHDLGVIAQTADKVAVMYAGKIVEYTDVRTLFADPKHPYTMGLLSSVPRPHMDELHPIPGNVPNPLEEIPGCRFHPRCTFAKEICRKEVPSLIPLAPGHQARCWLYG
ncbi:MAG: ABC transporter ATP-binding protein [Deltaproteobacteria bacterium]|nr:MAG: ABC transporter ATP-binding protein [Deltaproteobacteria bacterium]